MVIFVLSKSNQTDIWVPVTSYMGLNLVSNVFHSKNTRKQPVEEFIFGSNVICVNIYVG